MNIFKKFLHFIKTIFKKEENCIITDSQDLSNNMQNNIEENNKDENKDNNIIDISINNIDVSVNDIKVDNIEIKEENTVDVSVNDIKVDNTSIIYNSTINPKYEKLVVFLTPGHTDKTPGKHSPDCRLYEWKYNRELLKLIERKLDKLGIQHWNSHPEDSWVDKAHNNDNRDLKLRIERINKKYAEIKKEGKTAIMLSLHVNAAGNGEWKNATGWSAWTTKGQNNSDKLADCLYDAAEEILKPVGKTLRYDRTDGDRDFEANFYVIKNVNCVAVLTENFFMDNMKDVDWLLSPMGYEYLAELHVQGILKYIEKYL